MTLCVLLWANDGAERDLIAYEDSVLRLVHDHGGEIVQRLRPFGGSDDPAEIQVLTFPSEAAFDRFMEDDRRTAMSRLRDAAVARTQIFRVERACDRCGINRRRPSGDPHSLATHRPRSAKTWHNTPTDNAREPRADPQSTATALVDQAPRRPRMRGHLHAGHRPEVPLGDARPRDRSAARYSISRREGHSARTLVPSRERSALPMSWRDRDRPNG